MSDNGSDTSSREKPKKMGKLLKEAEKYKESLEKRGVIYMSRVPPFMKPNKARTLFEQYGEVTRLFLQEEDSLVRQRRKESGGNGSKQFSEGWVEFSDKKVAKRVAESLNCTPIGGKKGDFYHDDIWNLKYLKNFKWDYLTEKFAYEKRVKENKLKVAMMQAKRTNAEIAEQIEKSNVQRHVEERKRKREETGDAAGSSSSKHDNPSSESAEKKAQRNFKQQRAIGQEYGEQLYKAQPQLLSKVFAHDKGKGESKQ